MHELLLAARAGDIEKVKACLARGDNIEMQEGDSGTPLFCAAAENHLEVVKWLLERGARVRTANSYYWNALHVAVQKHHHTIVDELIKYLKFCDICKSLPATPRKRYGPFPGYGDHRDPYYAPRADTAIHIAAKYGNLYGL